MKDMNEIPIQGKYKANKWRSYISMMQEPSGFPSFVGIQKLSEEGEPLEGNIYIPERTCKNKRNDLNQGKEHDAPNNWYAFLCSECGMGQRLQYRNDHCPNCGAKVVGN